MVMEGQTLPLECQCQWTELYQDKVATDLENLEKSGNFKETSESKGICLKSQGIYDRIPEVRETRKVREVCCQKFIFNPVEGPNFENLLGSITPDPLNGFGLTVELNPGLGKSGNFILSGKWQRCKKRQPLHPTKNLCDALIINLV